MAAKNAHFYPILQSIHSDANQNLKSRGLWGSSKGRVNYAHLELGRAAAPDKDGGHERTWRRGTGRCRQKAGPELLCPNIASPSPRGTSSYAPPLKLAGYRKCLCRHPRGEGDRMSLFPFTSYRRKAGNRRKIRSRRPYLNGNRQPLLC